MPSIIWSHSPDASLQFKGSLVVPWLKAIECPTDATHLRIEATGEWQLMPGVLAKCDPDGLVGLRVTSDQLLMPDVPAGALIGKFGGSSASATPISVPGLNVPANPQQAQQPEPPLGSPASTSVPAGSPSGGSSAASITGRPFPISSSCIVPIPRAPCFVYVALNWVGRPVKVETVEVKFSTTNFSAP